jgi:glycerate 2-kinase
MPFSSAFGPWIERIIAAALAAVEPGAAVGRALARDGRRLTVGGRSWTLPERGRLLVVGAGKAGLPMARAVADRAGDLIGAGCVVVKEGHAGVDQVGPIAIREAGHPLPDERGVAAAQAIGAIVDSAGPDDLVLALLSGGASATLVAPSPGLSLADLQAATDLLLACGAPIGVINALRKHCEELKGGRLAQRAGPAAVAALIISDVVGSPLDVIASGPTVPDPTTYADVLAALGRYGVAGAMPPAVLGHLRAGSRGERPETPKPADPGWARVSNSLVASNEDARRAVAALGRAEGWAVVELEEPIEGEAGLAGQELGRRLRRLAANIERPTLLLGGGETTVSLAGVASGARGGRNQELALAAALELDGIANAALLALATDGGDGASPAAGALAGGDTLARARALGLDAAAALRSHNSYPFWSALGDAVLLGPTLTNVNDLVVGLAVP